MRIALLSSTILLAASTGLGAEQMGDAQEGFVFAKEVCANCHAIVSNETSPTLEAPTFDEIANEPGISVESLITRIAAVHPTMPSIPFEREELIDLATYILSSKNEGPGNSQ
jgi:mono/diheme cytochrome c family protein